MQKKPIIFFDFDGVIADTFNIAYSIMHRKFPAASRADYRAGFEMNINDAIKIWAKRGLKAKKTKKTDYFAEYTPRLLRLPPIRGVPKAIIDLTSEHTLLIISSTISDSIRQFLKKYGLTPYFAKIFGNDIQTSKVKKFKLALREFHSRPENCLFITDTLGDIREADLAGVPTIAVTWGYHPSRTLQKGKPLRIINRPAELARLAEKILTRAHHD